jgi:amidase
MNGQYGLKPSVSFVCGGPSTVILSRSQSTRLPYQGVSVSTDGQEHVPSVIGPMSRNIDSLIAVTKTVIDAAPWDLDPKCSPMPWRSDSYDEVQSRPLVIAVMRDDGVVRPHPPVSRVLEDVVAKLEAAGHEIVSWTPGSLHQECIDMMVSNTLNLNITRKLKPNRINTIQQTAAKTFEGTSKLEASPSYLTLKHSSTEENRSQCTNIGS